MPSAKQFWLPINKQNERNQVNDLLSGQAVTVPTGCAMVFNFCFTAGQFVDGNLWDLSKYTAIRFSILDPTLSFTYIDQTIENENFQTCTVEEFQAFTAQQLQVFVPGLQNTLTTTSGATGNYILRVYGIDADAAGDPDILCQFQINAYSTGISQNPQNALPFKVGTQLPFTCSDGKTRDFSLIKDPTGRYTWTISAPYNGPGQAVYSFLCADNLYRDVSLVEDSGNWTLEINPNGHN